MTKATQTNTAKRAVIYCRVSTREQVDDGNSLVSQERICREWALKNAYEVIDIFIEKGESAKTADRPELKRMMEFCTEKKDAVQAVIAYKVDRISRNLADYGYLRVKLKRAGVDIRSVTEFFEDNAAGRFMENIIANVGQFDNDVRTERCVGGMREAVREGRYVWMAPIGYSNVKVNGKSTIAKNEMAPLMREVFVLIAKRSHSSDMIRLLMAKRGLVNKKGQPLDRSNFYKLIRNPLYKGQIDKLGIHATGLFDPIVSEELFDVVQNILRGRKNPTKNYVKENPDFPLRRFVLHPSGKPLTGYWSQGKRSKYPYYSFNQPGTTIAKEALELKFMDFLSQYEFDTQHLNVMRDFLIKILERRVNDHDSTVEIEQRIAEINVQIDKLVDIHSKGGITITMLTDRTSKFETELEMLKGLLESRNEIEYDIPGLLTFAAQVLQNLQMLWKSSTFERKKILQVFAFPKGVTFDGEKFRTQEICSVLNLKSIFDNGLLTVVDYRNGRSNTASMPEKPASPSAGQEVLHSEKYWLGILSDLNTLREKMGVDEADSQTSVRDAA